MVSANQQIGSSKGLTIEVFIPMFVLLFRRKCLKKKLLYSPLKKHLPPGQFTPLMPILNLQ